MRTAIAAATAAGLVALAASSASAAGSAAPARPALTLVAPVTDVTLTADEEGTDLDLGAYLVAGNGPIEVRATRANYQAPVVAQQVVNGKAVTLPKGFVTDFSGLRKFLHIVLTDASGKKAAEVDQTLCLNGRGARTRPDAPPTSPYPKNCAANPFTQGAVWGLQAGWSLSTDSRGSQPVMLAVGKYKATVTVNKAYRDYFKIPAKQVKLTLNVTVVSDDEKPAPKAHVHAQAQPLVPHAARPTGRPTTPKGPKPDLVPVPAWGIEIDRSGNNDYLTFSATVWNAGPSPLVVDGFRRKNTDLMDAYQYFYDSRGREVGYQNTGTLEWDPREDHEHWHFTDFARYSLLNAEQSEVVRSQKEAFCLAATDAIDYTVKGANWHPENTDLHTACGELDSLSIREVLDVGSGDTYDQFRPGQSFDITDLPNGEYFVEVKANPEGKLFEGDTKNNTALRRVVLGGVKGARTVTVPPVGVIDVP
ncbi:lysyl oxidase family protein [Kribbella antibiotica]|uniref:lysyl oxidase family protein n=1 Tax=Kribbella antibiotica TaxID=190195 RepID=UPI001EE0E63E|nr:lysyl oxidase family protein [Kribbella antibiotica]